VVSITRQAATRPRLARTLPHESSPCRFQRAYPSRAPDFTKLHDTIGVRHLAHSARHARVHAAGIYTRVSAVSLSRLSQITW
jgi:hypothetical protein